MRIKKYLRYFWHVVKHKWFVGIECLKKGLIWESIVHDLSKFLPSEFFASANFYFGSAHDRKNWEIKFRFAWLKHLHRNKHHWQHWMLINDSFGVGVLEMPENKMMAMICDWEGCSKCVASRQDTLTWFKLNANNIKLHIITGRKVRGILNEDTSK